MTKRTRSTERRLRAAEVRAAQKAREDRTLRQIVVGCVALLVLITLGVGYAVFEATSSQRTPATSPTAPVATSPATPTANATSGPAAKATPTQAQKATKAVPSPTTR